MNWFIEYFTAASDAEATRALDDDNPMAQARDAPDIDPVVLLGVLEELLTDRSFEEIREDPLSAREVAARHDGEQLVISVSPALVSALAAASDETLEQVARPWSQSEVFFGAGDPAMLATLLHEFAALSHVAVSTGAGVYCRIIT